MQHSRRTCEADGVTRGSRWERRRYALWAPLYDFIVSPLRQARRRSLDGLALRAGERVLLVGAGTGEDLAFIPVGVFTVATDLNAGNAAACSAQSP